MDRGPGRRIAGLLAACLGAGLGLTACSGDDPSPTPASSVQPAETATPEVTVTPPPLLIGQPTPASAVAFVKYFWDAYNYAYASYDTSVLENISQDSCKYCASTISDVKQVSAARTRIANHEIQQTKTYLPSKDIKDRAVVLSVASQAPGTAIRSDGSTKHLDGRKDVAFTFALAWTGGNWLVHGVDIDKNSGTSWSS